ncbi:HAD family hydrolase [Enterococcus rivorum]|uniref:HAD family hydrolase n=1 Tax=Enterococcus rivorum TaxID=762845 RepID=A0A1E5L0X0_9ENTE|nr:HAD family phosphatase [Enterococcus rivorum]MBP2098662.1 HAD superfamily hydrolase (TIGR01509 family) [Enterococcus rivorum]OEH83757.1 HAD family hydrolase [Enterococcus rivorum]
MTKVEGVIFDMDGLLFDTELIYYRSTQKVADAMGFPYSRALYQKFIGVSDEEVQGNYHEIYKGHGKEKVDEFIRLAYEDTYQEFEAGNVPLKEGVVELLTYLEEKNIPRVVASSNVRSTIDLLLKNAEIRHYFDDIISCENVRRAKPDPEIFQVALARLGTSAEKTLILEDSYHGVTAAHTAGIPVIMVPDLLEPTKDMEEKTLNILTSLKEVPGFI